MTLGFEMLPIIDVLKVGSLVRDEAKVRRPEPISRGTNWAERVEWERTVPAFTLSQHRSIVRNRRRIVCVSVCVCVRKTY